MEKDVAPKKNEIKKPDYKGMIVKMVRRINDEKFLMRIYISLRDYLIEKAE